MSDEPIIHDLDKLKPPPQYIRILGRQIDVSVIPSGVALEIMQSYEDLKEAAAAEDLAASDGARARQILEQTLDLCLKVIRRPFSWRHLAEWWQSRRFTKRWLIRNTDIVQLRTFIDRTIALIFKSMEGVEAKTREGEDRKNA